MAPRTDEEAIEWNKKRIKADDSIAMHSLGYNYSEGLKGFPQDYNKALELWHRAAGELGYAKAYCSIGCAYQLGDGVEVDKKKAVHYYELAAIGGDVTARQNLGLIEKKAGNWDRALKHYMISSRGGSTKSLNAIKGLYLVGHATKEDYTKALQAYQEYLGEIKSDQRDKAAAADEDFKYYT